MKIIYNYNNYIYTRNKFRGQLERTYLGTFNLDINLRPSRTATRATIYIYIYIGTYPGIVITTT